MHHQGLSYVPEIIRIELTSHFGIEKSSRARCQEILRRPAVAPDTYSSSEGHQLRFDSRHRRSAYEDDTPVTIRSSSSSTSFRRCYATSWCRYRLMHPGFPIRLSATKTQSPPPSSGSFGTTSDFNCSCHPHVTYKEDIGLRSRFN